MEKAKKPESTEKCETPPGGGWHYLRQRWKWLIAAALLGFTGDAPIPHRATGDSQPQSIRAPSDFPRQFQERIDLMLGDLGLREMQWYGNTLQADWLGMQLTVEFSEQGNAHTLRAGTVTLTSDRPLQPEELDRVTQDLLLYAGRMQRRPAESPRSSVQRVVDGSLHAQDAEGKRWIITPDAMLPVEGEYRVDEAYREWEEAESEEEKQAAERKMEVRLRSPDGQLISQRHSLTDPTQFTRITRRGDTETHEDYRNGRIVSGWKKNERDEWLEEMRCNRRGQVEAISRYQMLPSGERRFLYTEHRYYRDDGSLEWTQRGGDFTSYARTGEQVAKRHNAEDKTTFIKPDGTTMGTFNDEKAKRPSLTEEEYFRELAATLTTPEHLQQYFHFFQYTDDELFHPMQLLLSPTATYQHPHTTARREVEGKLRGDCDDYALFFQEILRLQGHNAWTIGVNTNKSFYNDHSVCVWLRPRAGGKGFDVVSIDPRGVYINGGCIDGSRYEPYSDGVETPEEALHIIEKQFDCTLDPRAITVDEWNGLEYVLQSIDASQLLPGASQRTRMHPITALFYILRAMEFAGVAWMAGATVSHIRKRMQQRKENKRGEA